MWANNNDNNLVITPKWRLHGIPPQSSEHALQAGRGRELVGREPEAAAAKDVEQQERDEDLNGRGESVRVRGELEETGAARADVRRLGGGGVQMELGAALVGVVVQELGCGMLGDNRKKKVYGYARRAKRGWRSRGIRCRNGWGWLISWGCGKSDAGRNEG
jgi:hypothetical protein